jgi:LPXTG-motif cell wall-anchored protein
MFFQRRFFLILCSLVCVALTSQPVQAKLFQNSYVSFELPANWDCTLDGTEWVCVSKFAKQAKEAIIILTAKEAGATDSLISYKAHINTPRSLPDNKGKMVPSKVLALPKERLIANHTWVDGMHLGSEINSYYTRYLATIKDKLAILITLSAHKDHYTKYSSDFLKAVESLRVTAAKDILDSRASTTPAPSQEVIGTPILDIPSPGSDMPPEPSSGQDMKTKMMALALLIGAIGFYLWRKRKKH